MQQLLGYQASLHAAQLECYRLTCENQTLSDNLAKQLAESEQVTHGFEELSRLLVVDLEKERQAVQELKKERDRFLAMIQDLQGQLGYKYITMEGGTLEGTTQATQPEGNGE